MPAPETTIDLFISFSKHDEAWARKLFDSLVRSSLTEEQIFFAPALTPGTEWDPALSEALTTARVFVCFWSNHAKESNYVGDERAKFQVTMASEEQRRKVRKLITIPLEETKKEGETDPYSKYQWIDTIMKAGAYEKDSRDKGANKVDPNIWSRVVEDIEDEVNRGSEATPITLVAVAMTRDRIDSLDFNVALPNNDTLANAVKKMGIITDVSLLDRLDPTMKVGRSTLEAVLDDLNITVADNKTGPNEPREIHIRMPDGDSLAEALKKDNIMTVDDLLGHLKQNPGVALPNGDRLDNVLKQRGIMLDDLEALMIKTALRQYYSDSPLSWRPFGSPQLDILTIMQGVQRQYNMRLRTQGSSEPPFSWEPAEEFASNEAVKQRLSDERSVIVVDPLSLYESTVAGSFADLYSAFENEKALIMAFAPFVLPTPTSVMRELIKHRARRIWDYFFEPKFQSGKGYAKCGPDVGDAADINRWLLQTLKPQLGGAKSSGQMQANIFLGAGPGN